MEMLNSMWRMPIINNLKKKQFLPSKSKKCKLNHNHKKLTTKNKIRTPLKTFYNPKVIKMHLLWKNKK